MMVSGLTKQTIHKFMLGRQNNKPIEIDMPKDGHILHIDYDPNSDQFCVWAVVLEEHTALDSDEKWEKRTFMVSGTGDDLNKFLSGDELLDHLGTFSVKTHLIAGWFHGFEVRSAE
jgi:hypothetical protein